jgi:rod shape-determining protein MreB
MIGRTPGYIVAVRPLRGGAITDFEITERMIRLLLQRVGVSRFTRPKVVICVPSAITEVERRAVTDAARRAGAADANLIEQPMAAAIGADLPVHEPSGNMIVDIGGGTTEVAVISLGGIVTAQSVRVAGDELDDAVLQYVKKEFSLAIGDRTAEEIKIQMGSVWPMEEELTADIRGRDLISGLPRTIELTTEHVREALAEPIAAVVDAVKTTLDKTPPELAADIMEDGITITGGGALLGGLDERLGHETGMPIRIADEPLYSVVIGSGRALENIDAMRGLMSLGGED